MFNNAQREKGMITPLMVHIYLGFIRRKKSCFGWNLFTMANDEWVLKWNEMWSKQQISLLIDFALGKVAYISSMSGKQKLAKSKNTQDGISHKQKFKQECDCNNDMSYSLVKYNCKMIKSKNNIFNNFQDFLKNWMHSISYLHIYFSYVNHSCSLDCNWVSDGVWQNRIPHSRRYSLQKVITNTFLCKK